MGLIYLLIILMLFSLVHGIISVISSVSAETYENVANFVVATFQDITFEEATSLEFYKEFLKGAAEILKADIENAVNMLTTVVLTAVACVLASIVGSGALPLSYEESYGRRKVAEMHSVDDNKISDLTRLRISYRISEYALVLQFYLCVTAVFCSQRV